MLAAAVKVNVLVPVPGAAIVAGENEAVSPAGIPFAESATAALNPLSAVVVTGVLMVPPVGTLSPEAPAVSLSPGTATTLTLRVVLFTSDPPVAVSVMV